MLYNVIAMLSVSGRQENGPPKSLSTRRGTRGTLNNMLFHVIAMLSVSGRKKESNQRKKKKDKTPSYSPRATKRARPLPFGASL